MPKKDSRLIIYEKMCNVMFYAKKMLQKYPKSERFDICTDIKQSELRCLQCILFAWKQKDAKKRYDYLYKADNEIYILKTFIRLSFMSKYITDQNYKTWNDQLTEIGKMIGGWMKTCQNA